MPVRRRPSASTVPMAVLTRSTNSSTLWRAAARAAPCTVASCGDVTRAAARGARRATSRGRIESETAGSGRGGTVRCRVDELRTSNRSALVLCTWTVLLFLYPHHIRTSNGFCTYYVPRSSSHNINSYFTWRNHVSTRALKIFVSQSLYKLKDKLRNFYENGDRGFKESYRNRTY